MRAQLRLTAVLAVVVLSLTGFSARGGHGGHGGHGSGGGGCSSSHQNHGGGSSYRDHDDDDDDYGGGSGGYEDPYPRESGSPSGTAVATVVRCAGDKGAPGGNGRAEVVVRHTRGFAVTYRVRLTFRDASGAVLTRGEGSVHVPAGGEQSVEIAPEDGGELTRIRSCQVAYVGARDGS
ncbi:hypothetical protein SLNWT_4328 [Streptomyces albus]|uniref:Secreted protein n=1 Tax=Streptomyces albus (strain ATCC 21838 / DSM 41398 / FERM P-419 / JCM 4703 / NBRC 107858) TaxID=1081613 RepID=A0A0B5ESM5_STRA4|nr:hypothetical protein SLNWT_4328 [Streptomyces albus]AOU79010.1 hypothetical protein SLNHY_4319 [Streptomyces albus]AYN34747.1 hypothetical protein DUI70_4248 [Streptomyces albus]